LKRRGPQSTRHTTIAAADFFRPEVEPRNPGPKIQNMPNISLHTKRLAAALGQIDENTVERVIAGRPTRPATRERALEGLRAAGVSSLTLDEIVAAKGNAVPLGAVADAAARVAGRKR
jgi:hypothetical protein